MPAQVQVPAPMFNPPKTFYLALGDSITYGYQKWKVDAGLPPSAFNTGYVDVFVARLRQIQPGITIINYGCPGETSASFITGPCLWCVFGQQLHDSFSGGQLEAAVAFLRTHPGEVSPITLTLWGNDVAQLVGFCDRDLTCIQEHASGLITQLAFSLSTILDELRSAAPNAEIIVMGARDSFIGAFAFADPLFQALDASIAQVTAAKRARFADPFPIFNPQGDRNREEQAICTLTLLCTQGDSHPSDAAYQALADVVFDASGYNRLLE